MGKEVKVKGKGGRNEGVFENAEKKGKRG